MESRYLDLDSRNGTKNSNNNNTTSDEKRLPETKISLGNMSNLAKPMSKLTYFNNTNPAYLNPASSQSGRAVDEFNLRPIRFVYNFNRRKPIGKYTIFLHLFKF